MKLKQKVVFNSYNQKVVKCTMRCLIEYGLNNDLYYEFEVVGIAKCHNDDKFDEDLGKRISESRASIKAYSTAKRYMASWMKLINDHVDQSKTDMVRLNDLLDKETNHYDSIIGEVNL